MKILKILQFFLFSIWLCGLLLIAIETKNLFNNVKNWFL